MAPIPRIKGQAKPKSKSKSSSGSRKPAYKRARMESSRDFVERHLLSKKNSMLGFLAGALDCSIAHIKNLIPQPLKISNCDRVLIASLFTALENEEPDAMSALKRIMDNRDDQKPNIEQDVGLELAGLFLLEESNLMQAEYEPRGEAYDLDLEDEDLPEGFKDLVRRLRTQLASL